MDYALLSMDKQDGQDILDSLSHSFILSILPIHVNRGWGT
jgi:hypothetical protein